MFRILLLLSLLLAGCANITAPTGGKKDKIPPKIVTIDPADSLLNTKVKRIEIHFDEYITVSDVSKEVQMSPILSIQPVVLGKNKTVIVKIVDSLLEANTTYRLSFGNAIKDLHEGNVFAHYTYTFSTGAYFDSLQLKGNVIRAATGLPDSGGTYVELYYASESDSAVVRHKPKYVTKTDASGAFLFKGLPKRSFRIYALKDANDNLIYDGPAGGELVGFTENAVLPGDAVQAPISLKLFAEIPDTAAKKSMDSTANAKKLVNKPKDKNKNSLTYTVNVDTSNVEKRSFDIANANPVKVVFNNPAVINKDKITLTYDSAAITISPPVTMVMDSLHNTLRITTAWTENMVYKLRLVKGFAKDTAGADVMPSRYLFRTKEDDDYGIITVHLPAKYFGPGYLLRILADGDSIYQKPVTDTIVTLTRLKPGKYTFRVIVDKNRNGKWDTGDLFAKKQPEEVITYPEQMNLKAGWENTIDFEQKPQPVPKPNDKIPK